MKKIIKLFTLLLVGSSLFITACNTDEKLSNQKNDLITYVDGEIDTLESSLISTIDETIAKINALEEKYDAKVLELEGIDASIKEVQDAHTNEIDSLINELGSLVAQYETKISELESKDKELKDLLSALELEIANQNELNEAKHNSLTSEIEETKGDLAKLEEEYNNEVKTLNDNLGLLQKELNDFELQVANQDKVNAETHNNLLQDISEITNQITALDNKYKAETDTLKERQRTLQDELNVLEEKIENNETIDVERYNELLEEISSLNEELSDLSTKHNNEVKTLSDNLNLLQKELDDFELQVENQDKANAETHSSLLKSITNLTNELSALDTKHSNDVTSLNTKLGSLQNELNELETLMSEQDKLMKEEYTSLVNQLEEVDKEIKEVNENQSKNIKEIEDNIALVNETHERDIETLTNQKNEIIEEINTIKTDIESLNSNLSKEISDVKTSLNLLESMLKNEDTRLQGEITKLNNLVDTLSTLIESNNGKINELQQELGYLKSEVEDLKSETEDLRNELEEKVCDEHNVLEWTPFSSLKGDLFERGYCTKCDELIIREIESNIEYYDGDEYTYQYIVADEVAITSYNGTSTDIKVPGYIMYHGFRYRVTRIDWLSDTLTSVEIPNTVIEISKYAFNLPNGKQNTTLNKVIISEGVRYIGDSAFTNCAVLEHVELPETLEYIGEYAFCECSSLTSIDIPDSVTTIGSSAFSGCSSLNTFKIPNSITYIDSFTFNECSSLTSIEIPNSVTSIGYKAFSGCSSLTNITIPNSVTSIGNSAFLRCISLESIYFCGTIKDLCNIDNMSVLMINNIYVLDENNNWHEVSCYNNTEFEIIDYSNEYSSIIEIYKDYYYFEVNENGEWISNNKNVHNSEATIWFNPKVDGILTFDVVVSSESSCDKFKYNNTYISGEQSKTISINMTAANNYSLSYSKDGSVNNGKDNAILRNIKFTVSSNNTGTYVVTFDSNIDINFDSIVVSGVLLPENMPELPIFEGYVFAGWTLNGEEYSFNTLLDSNITLKANWIKEHTVTLDYGYSNIFDIVKTTDCIEEPNVPTREGYIFDGWYYNDIKWDFTNIIEDDITLIAHWKDYAEISYTIVFCSNNRYNETSEQIITLYDAYFEDIKLNKNIFEFDDNIFMGWSLYNDDNVVNYIDEELVYEIIYDINPQNNEEIRLYAVWKENYIVNSPVTETVYKLACRQENTNKFLYFTGAMSGNYFATTEDISSAADVILTAVEGGYSVKVVANGSTKYINLEEYISSSGNKNALLRLQDAPTTVWVFNTEYNTLTSELNGNTYYMGTYNSFETLSASKISYAPTSFVAHLYTNSYDDSPVPGGLTITYDFSGVEGEAVQHSSYNVFDGVSILTSTGVELKTRAIATSDCTLIGKLLDTSEVRTCKIDYSVTFKTGGVEYTETATRNVTIREAIVEEGNLVTNGNFELGLDHWELATHEGGTGDLTLDRTDVMGVQKNAAKVVMSGLNWTNDSSPRLNSATYATGDVTKTFTMIGGQNYRVSFKAKALTTKYVTVEIGRLMPATPWYERFTSGEQTYKAEVTSEWKEFSYEFTATHATLEQCSIVFNMGRVAPTADVITTLWFTDVYVGVYSGDVTDDKAPTLGGLNDVTVAASSTPYNVLNGVTANDNVDGNISEAIVAKYNGNAVTTINVSNPGEYVINYEVSDAAGNKATGSRKIIVVAAGTNLLAGVNAERMKTDSWAETWITQSFTDETDGSIKVHTIGIGEQSYLNQVNLKNLPCVGGQSYTLTFEIKTSYDLKVQFIQNQTPYKVYTEANISAFSGYQTISLNINADQIDPVNKLTMELGLVGNDITFYIRNFKLTTLSIDEKIDETATIMFNDKSNRTIFNTSQQVWEQNGVTVTNNKASSKNAVADYSNPVRFYMSSSLTIEYSEEIVMLVFDCAYTDKAFLATDAIDGATVTVDASGKVCTIVLDEPATSFTIASLPRQIRANSIKVYTIETDEIPEVLSTTVYFSKPSNWDNTIYAYTWDESGHFTNGAWPGSTMKYDSTTGYYYIENIMSGTNIIFSHGTYQTEDLSVPFDGSNIFTVTTLSSNGRSYTGEWTIYSD